MTAQKKTTSELIHDVHNFSINVESREIFLNSHIADCEEEAGVDWRMATKFNKNIRLLTSGPRAENPILIHMHTVGGNWEDGLAIYDIMGDMGFDGQAQSFEAEAEWAKKDHSRMLDIYVESAYQSDAYRGKSKKQIKNFIDRGLRLKQEWYMSARDAIEHGYADAVFGDEGYEDMDTIKRIGTKS